MTQNEARLIHVESDHRQVMSVATVSSVMISPLSCAPVRAIDSSKRGTVSTFKRAVRALAIAKETLISPLWFVVLYMLCRSITEYVFFNCCELPVDIYPMDMEYFQLQNSSKSRSTGAWCRTLWEGASLTICSLTPPRPRR